MNKNEIARNIITIMYTNYLRLLRVELWNLDVSLLRRLEDMRQWYVENKRHKRHTG